MNESEKRNETHSCCCSNHHHHEHEHKHEHHHNPCEEHHEQGCCCSNQHHHEHEQNSCGCSCGCGHELDEISTHTRKGRIYIATLVASTLLVVVALLLEHLLQPHWFVGNKWVEVVWYLVAFIPIAWKPFLAACKLLFKKFDLFNEIFLMVAASIGAFAIGEYPEAVMLLVLYAIGEWLEERASNKAHGSIQALIDQRPSTVKVCSELSDEYSIKPSAQCKVGEYLFHLPGERLALDGELISDVGTFDVSAITGESLPAEMAKGAELKAGTIVLAHPIKMRVSKPYDQSNLAQILNLIESTGSRKPKTEHFIRRFSRYYTRVVFAIALLIVLIPYIYSLFVVGATYNFSQYFGNALVFLVTSCPCAFIISVPLSYYSGMGAASRRGLLIKGSLFLERLMAVRTFIFDKTGTLSKGSFQVTRVEPLSASIDLKRVGQEIYGTESRSTHPLAQAVCSHWQIEGLQPTSPQSSEELPGLGMVATTQQGEELLIGNAKLMEQKGIALPQEINIQAGETVLWVAMNKQLACALFLADQLRPSAASTVKALAKHNKEVVILSGDHARTVSATAQKLGVERAYGELLPIDKVNITERLAKEKPVAFVGDGINDAPVMALCNVSFAMGGIGSDAAIEAADIVIQSDDPYRTVDALDIAKKTRHIVIENISLALLVKMAVMILALLSMGNLVLAIVADMGVTLVAILNALRVLRMSFKESSAH